MKLKFSNATLWIGRLALIVSLVVLSASTVLAFDVTGTVANPTGKSGRIYLTVQNSMNGGGTPIAGVSIASAGAYTIRGLTDPGNYQVSAFADTQDNGVRHANDPIGTSAVFTDTASSGVDFSLTLPAPPFTLQPPKEANVIYGDTTATIFYKGKSDNNGNPIATTYNIYWSTTPNPGPGNMVGGGSVTGLPSGSKDFFVKYDLSNPTSNYNFAITAVLDGVESAPVNANPAPPTTGVNVSGTVTTSGITLPGSGTHLLMVMMDQSTNSFITYSFANPTNNQAFSFSGVPAGSYTIYTIFDMNNNGLIDLGDISDTDKGVSVTVGASDVSGVAVNLAAADARTYVQTRHYSGDTYSLSLGAATLVKRPVNVAVSGPQIPTMDLGLSSNDNGKFETWKNVPSRPNFPTSPDTYSFEIEYSSGGGTSPLTAPITGIVDYFATPTAPLGVISYPAPDPLQFSWNPPTPGPAYPYTYSFQLNNPNGWFNNDPYWNMSSSTTSINISGTDLTPQQGVNYNWSISLNDSYGNSSENDVNFSAGGSGSISGMVTSDGSHGTANTYAVLLDLSGRPVSGVPAVQTDPASGGYFINNVPTGNYYLYFSAGPGYQSQYFDNQPNINPSTTQLVVTNGSSTNGINAVLPAAPNTGTIAGHVADASNVQPVFNAMVELLNASNSSLVTQVYTTSTGDFQISTVAPGTYKLRLSASGFRTMAPLTQYLVQSGVTTFVSLNLPNTVTYTSRVMDSATTPAPIANALVEVVGGTTSTLTDSNGYFTITVPVSTSFYMRISKASYVTTYTSTMSFSQDSDTSDRPYSLLASSDYDAMFTLTSPNSVAKIAGTGSISGRVASAGNPLMTLPGATVTAVDASNPLITYPVCYDNGSVDCTMLSTNANGRFYVLNVSDGKQVTVTTTKSGYNNGSRSFSVFADSATMGRVGMATSTTSYSMISKLVDFNTGTPVANSTIMLYKHSDNSTVGQIPTDNNTLFTAADLLSGGINYYLKFNPSGYLESYSANTSAGQNMDRSNRPFFMFPSNQLTLWGFGTLNAVITGTVKDSLTGQPIAGATVSASTGTVVYDDGTGNPGNPASYTSTSAANGRFYIYGISAAAISTTATVTIVTAPGYDITSPSAQKQRTYHVLNGRISQGGFYLNQTFPPTMIGISGSVTDISSLPLAGARVAAYFLSPSWSMINNPVLTDSNGNFSIGVPSGTPFALEFIDFGYRSAYSQDFQVSQASNFGAFPLLTTNNYAQMGWPLTNDKTFIRGLALDNLSRPLSGVVLAPTPSSYTVNYVNDADNKTLTTGGATFTNGLFVIKDATPSDYISLTASKNGYSFNQVSFSHMVLDTDSMGGAVDTTPVPGFMYSNQSFYDYGSVPIGGGPFIQPITINNSGPGDITINSFSLSGNTGDFAIVPGGTCSTITPATFPTGSCTLMISFSPSTTGLRSATLNISSNATSGTNYTILLSGNVLAVAPGAPTITSVTPWEGQATVNFNPPAFDGGSQIQFYTITVTPGPMTFNTSNTSFTVNGLTNGTSYAFWVSATNGVGTGPDSSPTSYATPYFAPIRINNTTGYSDLAGAITASVAGDTIMLQQTASPIALSTPYTITKGINLYGGYSSDYLNPNNGSTIIPSRVNIKPISGQVSFRNIIVR